MLPLIETTLREADVGSQSSSGPPSCRASSGWIRASSPTRSVSSCPPAAASSREPAPGLHGTGIDSVQVGDLTLTSDAANRIAYGPDTEFTVNFTNQGENDEVGIQVVLKIEGGDKPIRVTKTVASVAAGASAAATLGLGSEPPLDTPVTITVEVKPVPGEEKKDNNVAEYDAAFFRE